MCEINKIDTEVVFDDDEFNLKYEKFVPDVVLLDWGFGQDNHVLDIAKTISKDDIVLSCDDLSGCDYRLEYKIDTEFPGDKEASIVAFDNQNNESTVSNNIRQENKINNTNNHDNTGNKVVSDED